MGAKLVAVPVPITVAVFLAACTAPAPPQTQHTATMTVTVPTPASAPPSAPPVAASPIAVGQKAIDGAFAFTVKSSRTDDVVDWDEPGQVNAQGIFVLVDIQVENLGRSSQTYSADYQRLLDSDGRQYSPDRRATTQQYSGHIDIDINPGNTASAGLVFDVPNGTQPSQYVLLVHGSLASPGVTLSIPPEPPRPTFAPTADDDQRVLEKLASEPYVPSGRLPVWTANPALTIKAGRDTCLIYHQYRHIKAANVDRMLEQHWGIDGNEAAAISLAAVETYANCFF